MILFLSHFDDLGPVYNVRQTLSSNTPLTILSPVKFIPPAKEEVASDQLEPRCERIRCSLFVTR